MRALGLDSASPSPAIALVRDAEDDTEPLVHGAAEVLVRRLRDLLTRNGADVASLERIGVVSGPGSFTGVRAGIAFTRGLARARGIPLVARSTFEAASAALPSPADVAFVLDAGRGDVHAAWRVSGELSEEAAPLPRERALEQAARRGLPVHDLGASPLNLAAAVARLAASASDIEPVLARYGRPSAAEEKRAAALEAR